MVLVVAFVVVLKALSDTEAVVVAAAAACPFLPPCNDDPDEDFLLPFTAEVSVGDAVVWDPFLAAGRASEGGDGEKA